MKTIVLNSRKVAIIATLSAILVALPIVSVGLPTAHAYGKTALWQIGLSENCDNKTLCLQPPFGIGGFWGWVEFDSDGTADAQLTGCSHLSTSLGVITGADHISINASAWHIAQGSAGPATFFVDAGTATFSRVNTKGMPVAVPLAVTGLAGDIGIPAVAGHYSFTSVMGFTPPPGIQFQIQVVQLTH